MMGCQTLCFKLWCLPFLEIMEKHIASRIKGRKKADEPRFTFFLLCLFICFLKCRSVACGRRESGSCSLLSDSLWPHGLCSPWNSPGQNTGVGSLLVFLFSRGSSQPRSRIGISCLAGGFFTNWAIREGMEANSEQALWVKQSLSCVILNTERPNLAL